MAKLLTMQIGVAGEARQPPQIIYRAEYGIALHDEVDVGKFVDDAMLTRTTSSG